MPVIAFIVRISSDESKPNSYYDFSVREKSYLMYRLLIARCVQKHDEHTRVWVCVCLGVCVSDPYKTDLPKMLTQIDIGHRQHWYEIYVLKSLNEIK
jgi:hypothetical protein